MHRLNGCSITKLFLSHLNYGRIIVDRALLFDDGNPRITIDGLGMSYLHQELPKFVCLLENSLVAYMGYRKDTLAMKIFHGP